MAERRDRKCRLLVAFAASTLPSSTLSAHLRIHTDAFSSSQPASPIPEYPRLRTRRACHICRRRKVKCNGASPSCEQCLLRGAKCFYKDDAPESTSNDSATGAHNLSNSISIGDLNNGSSGLGNRGTSPLSNDAKRRKTDPSPRPPTRTITGVDHSGGSVSSASADPLASDSNNTIGNSPMHNSVYSGITAVNPGIESFIYYGPAASFSFIQHIHQAMNSGSMEMGGMGDVPEGIKAYGFRDLFLGGNSDPTSQGSATRNGIKFLDPASATKFVDNYYRTLAFIMPVYPRAYIDSVVDLTYRSTSPISNAEPGMLGVLATGASLEGEIEWSQMLYDRAMDILQATSDVISTDRVKVLLLLSHLQAMNGKINTSYTLSGQAVRLAYSCGLHREFPSLSAYSSDGSTSSQDRRTTLWALYSFERLLAILIGRPSAFNDAELDIALPEVDFLKYMSHLAKISVKCTSLIYGPKNKSVLSIWDSAKLIDEELVAFRDSLPPALRFEDFGKPGVVLHADAFAMGSHFYLFKTLTFRPFLLIDSLLRKEDRLHSMQGLTSPPQSSDREFLPEACHRAVEAGRGLLLLLARAYSSDPMLAKMRFNSIFLQTACAILLFDVLRDPTRRDEVMTNFEIINIALECYRLMKTDVGVQSGLKLIEQVQERAKQAFEMANAARRETPMSAGSRDLFDSPADQFGKSPVAPPMPGMTGTDALQPPDTQHADLYGSTHPNQGPTAALVSEDDLNAALTGDDGMIGSDAGEYKVKSEKTNGLAGGDDELRLDNMQFWEHWDEGFDWLKSGFMLPSADK
ncbi:hypothetical protein BZA70DRAFT_5922 [Myxozyma melibiosi]|uniref:Zn(2)-C6 fungal-type domain-containing protein n=1 Tax=Myxozyma melibiosi TaxID=54550 RepID=A0ABR1FDC1_9ASCO